ncbi:hypothetical protein L915_01374 [Phytophthora nicotianae]|uniref:Uncharacterized protein n=1 Tax=Phytophthora nicotianae TaxID=4792 RepID=W2JTM1_PHYNI|nr:hypothetical protein L915_01374 [Phytophthora nicotianae]ETL49117.1 hypothetical protein L916_01344 [Phytophthora nicotianae]ETM55416.1 hypothetical protein L914_01355 [Phytophthora nicotianae]
MAIRAVTLPLWPRGLIIQTFDRRIKLKPETYYR